MDKYINRYFEYLSLSLATSLIEFQSKKMLPLTSILAFLAAVQVHALPPPLVQQGVNNKQWVLSNEPNAKRFPSTEAFLNHAVYQHAFS